MANTTIEQISKAVEAEAERKARMQEMIERIKQQAQMLRIDPWWQTGPQPQKPQLPVDPLKWTSKYPDPQDPCDCWQCCQQRGTLPIAAQLVCDEIMEWEDNPPGRDIREIQVHPALMISLLRVVRSGPGWTKAFDLTYRPASNTIISFRGWPIVSSKNLDETEVELVLE